jgi:hypothetical protein
MKRSDRNNLANVKTFLEADNQPTLQELHTAWTDAINCESIGGARAETRQRLQELRNAKHTWVGAEENKLRFALDAYLNYASI